MCITDIKEYVKYVNHFTTNCIFLLSLTVPKHICLNCNIKRMTFSCVWPRKSMFRV